MYRSSPGPHSHTRQPYAPSQAPQSRPREQNNNHTMQASHPEPYTNGHGGRQDQYSDERDAQRPLQHSYREWNGAERYYQQNDYYGAPPGHDSRGHGGESGPYEGGYGDGSSYGAPPSQGNHHEGDRNARNYQEGWRSVEERHGPQHQGHYNPAFNAGPSHMPWNGNDFYAPPQQQWQQQSRSYGSGPHHRNDYPPQHYQQPVRGGRGEGPFSKPAAFNNNNSATPRVDSLARSSPRRFDRDTTPPRSPHSRAGSPRIARAVGPPPPTASYLASSLLPVSTINASPDNPSLLILDLNNTLLCRLKKTGRGSRNPVLRDYLATFLEYVCGPIPLDGDAATGEDGEEKGKRGVGHRWEVVVYSSARATNVLFMLSAMALVSRTRADAHPPFGSWTAAPGDPLSLVWSREKLGLSRAEFTQNVETVKDLSMIWGAEEGEGRWTVERSVLLDDDAYKAAMQPHSHLPIVSFEADPNHPTPPSSPRERSLSPQPTTPREASPGPHDTALLSTIYLLSILRTQSNIPAFIRADGLREYIELGDEELERRGREECENAGIAVRRQWDAGWWRRCERKRNDIEGEK